MTIPLKNTRDCFYKRQGKVRNCAIFPVHFVPMNVELELFYIRKEISLPIHYKIEGYISSTLTVLKRFYT